jgi:hypothetical protein
VFSLDGYVSSLVLPLLDRSGGDVERAKKTKPKSLLVPQSGASSSSLSSTQPPAAVPPPSGNGACDNVGRAAADNDAGGIFASALPLLDRLESAKEGLHDLADATSSRWGWHSSPRCFDDSRYSPYNQSHTPRE